LENGFRAFAEAFPFFLQLLEKPEAGGALGECAVDFLLFALGFAKLAGECGDTLLRGGDGFVGFCFFGAGFGNARIEFGDTLGVCL